ncbi:thioesterase II family protein [Streptomyces roseifaciens]|uniref:thioesterase II family protein n=1 Tax=Streptomyces roseifaciens TaxID=1488406 RepID=UPI0007182D6C|nr:thioesterase domain-containing protein [Streptomyces roseifaciens]
MSPVEPLVATLPRDALWFPRFGAPPPAAGAAGTVLICFPYAGGTASVYRDWREHLGGGVADVAALQLPGRGLRMREEPYTSADPLVADVADELVRRGLTGDYAFFGHSMGALLAYEVGCALRERGEPGPRHLFVSGSRAPHLYGDRTEHLLPDAELHRFAAGIGALGDGDRALLNDAYLARRLPVLRADLQVCNGYRWRPRRPLDCPMTAFSASDDPVAGAAEVEAWRAYTTSSFLRHHVPGDHFFLTADGPSRERLLRELRGELARLPRAAALTTTDGAATPPSEQRDPSWTY